MAEEMLTVVRAFDREPIETLRRTRFGTVDTAAR